MEQDITALKLVIDIYSRIDNLTRIIDILMDMEPILPKNNIGYDLLSYGYYKAKKYEKAIKYGELALGATSGKESLAIRYNLGKCYLNANFPEKARDCYELLVKLNSEPDLKLDLSATYYACNMKEESNKLLLSLYENISSFPEKTQDLIKFNLGTHFMYKGDFKKGMEYLSIGRKIRVWGSYTHKLPIPEWNGTIGRILIVGEGGIGDELINARFAKHLSDLGNIVTFASCHNLASIISRIPGVSSAINYNKLLNDIDPSNYDYWIPAMSLPKFLRLDFIDLWYGNYLTTNPEYNSKWKLEGNLKIGLKWSGNPLYEQDLHRTIPLDRVYEKVSKIASKSLFSLQKDDIEILDNYPDIMDLSGKLETFEDCLACLNNLDLVITSCTSIAHASAALGKKTIIFIPIMDYYIWGEELSKSSWYGDNVMLIRQVTPRSWKEPLDELENLLTELF